MNYQPKISVIVPVYNTEKYLSKCLDSILNQTLKEIEIIVVNDGSKDNSQEIIEEYKEKDSRIISKIKSNGGLSDARNCGIEKVNGEYLAFIDSDDYIDPVMLQTMLDLAEKHESEIVMCDLVKVDENGNEFRDLPQSPQLPEKIILKDDFTIFGEMSCFACNKIFKKSLFEKHQFKKGIHFEDIELIPKLVLDSTIISKINQPFYKYFERQDSITKTHTAKGLDMFFAINEVSDYFYKSNYNTFATELKRFQIIQGYYSYLAYVAFVKDKNLKREMLDALDLFLRNNHLTKKAIKNYQRFDEKYINSLPIKKRIFYQLSFINLKLLNKF
ncbi:Glycosyltransferase involved in cell wall bisynthesis [Algoriella xinjiangensis]|uniref:Glycosyltransferase involved in cell wall bisynthesis n=1 Tax=Algoriella xinjiangensis TaxID=684065 RepID=A0A1I4VHH1_9FLAO|nr:glycosyltransferase [Algoriella xinjiangensis]SFN00662.1 Glycosyltransferase involved in cell wall bisynthesis [Algoriella xinjiangensis]VDH17174.1 Hyaluronan synthase [Algoriella xinjiangensis]